VSKGTSPATRQWSIAIALSVALFLSVGGFIYLTVVLKPEVVESRGFAAASLFAAILLYSLAEAGLLSRISGIRMSLPVRGQMNVWAAWLAILGITPDLDPQRFPQSRIALVGGAVMLIASIKALLFSTSARGARGT
jgi:hypothetical protein